MKFSVHIPTAAEGLAHPVPFASASDLVMLAGHAERLGYDGVWGNYHVSTQSYVRERYTEPPSYYDTLVVLAALSIATSRLELGTAVLFPAAHLMPVLAKQVATLDRLSQGRFRLGMGVGAYREEFEAVWPGKRSAHRGDWLDESLDALRQLFTERSATYAGKYISFEAIESFPKPQQNPLPIYVGGHNRRAIERAARWGQGWLPGWQPYEELRKRIAYLRECLASHGRPDSAVEVAPQFSVTVADTDERAIRAYWRSGIVMHRQSLAYTGRDLSQQVGANLIGSAATIGAKLRELEAMGVDHCCALWFSTNTVHEMVDQMERFAAEVIDPLRPSLESGGAR